MCCPSPQSGPKNSPSRNGDLRATLALLALKEDIRAEGERLREHMTICMERIRRDIHTLIDTIELMKHLDS
jgi:hypothetical protein